MRIENDNLKITKFNPSIDENFESSEIFPKFGQININKGSYTGTVAMIVSASEDIEINKVVDFIKDYIPTLLDEFAEKKYLNRIKSVNEKLSQTLSETLEGESFIDVSLGYVLFDNEFFYVSIDDDFDLTINRGTKTFDIRASHKGTVDGSGILKSKDILELFYNGVRVISWTGVEEQRGCGMVMPPIYEQEEQLIKHEEMYGDSDDENVETLGDAAKDATMNYSQNDVVSVNEENFENINDKLNDDEEITEDETFNAVSTTGGMKSKISGFTSNMKDKSAPLLEKFRPAIKKVIDSYIKNVGEAFSYLITIITKGKKGNRISSALPNKSKGFLMLAATIFFVFLLVFFIKSAGDESAKKQADLKFNNEVSQVDTDIKNVESSPSFVIGDRAMATKLDNLRNEVKGIDTSIAADKKNAQDKVNDFNNRINSLQDKIDGVIRVDESSVISKFSGLISNAQPTDIAYQNGKIYFTEMSGKKIYQADANNVGSPSEIISSGLTKPISLEFSKSKLLVLDQDNGVFSADTTAKKITKLKGYDTISNGATTLRTYVDPTTDNFYVLQPSNGFIQRIQGLGNGTFSLPGKYNKDSFDAEVSDFTIIDGMVYTIDVNGVITRWDRRSSTGAVKDVTFTLNGLDKPIGPNAKLAGMPAREDGPVYLFVSDPSNDRILVFDNKSSNGNVNLVAQLKASDEKIFDFKNIKSILVDESTGKTLLYAISPYGLFSINISLSH